MERISSKSVFASKWLFPVVWFGFLGVWSLMVVVADARGRGGIPIPMLIFPVVAAAFGYFLMKKLLWDLADEVLDAGDALVVRFGRKEERIPLANIMNVSYAWMMSPPRVTLLLRTPGLFGKEVSFAAPRSFWPLSKNPVIGELIERVDAARMAAR